MSDAYNVDGITVTPGAGGWYVLTGPGIENAEGEKVQGKEAADKRAAEIAKSAAPPEGDAHIPAQPSLDDAALVDPAIADEHKARADAAEEKNAALSAQLTEMNARFEKLEKLMGGISTVMASDEPAPQGQVPPALAREYTGQMDPKQRQLLEDAGLEVMTIVLEENDSIPPTGLFLGHNGRAYMIKPGEEVDVPSFLVELLNNAVMSTPVLDPVSKKTLGWRDRSKYPYRVIDKG